MPIKFVNLTPHDIVIILSPNDTKIIRTQGYVRVKQEEQIVNRINRVPIVQVRYTQIEGLPEKPEEDTIYIVSMIVAQALMQRKDWDVWKDHIAVPNTGPTEHGAVRDKNGKIIGVKSLIMF